MTRRQDKVKANGLRYIGEGAFLPHVPARDLAAAEVEQYADALSEAEAAGTLAWLYEPIVVPSTSSGAEGAVGGVVEKGEVVNA